MGRPKTGLQRDNPIPFRLNDLEKVRLERMAKRACLPRATYMRCKLFGIPYELHGGKNVKEKSSSHAGPPLKPKKRKKAAR